MRDEASEKHPLDELRHIEGFPIGEDEDLRALSDPPQYTAYPNPYVADFIKRNEKPQDKSTDDYHRTPYVQNEKFGRTDDVYNCHSYHTKVPPQAIQRYIRHYLDEKSLVLDPFCGTGMTGVAAQREGCRAVLADLSPYATFIAANNCTEVSPTEFRRVASSILKDVRAQYGHFYRTGHAGGQTGIIRYTVWSDVVECPYCNAQQTYWELLNGTPREIKRKVRNRTHVLCSCGAVVESGNLGFVLDTEGHRTQVPVRISYSVGSSRFTKEPDERDLEVIRTIDEMIIPHWYPNDLYMRKGKRWGDQWRGYHVGIERVADFYMKRNLTVLAALYERIRTVPNKTLRNKLLYVFTATLPRLNLMNRYMPKHNRHVGPLSGTLYVSKLPVEINVFVNFENKVKRIARTDFHDRRNVMVSTQSASDLSNIPENSIDYVFTDPPFGDNLPYAELNYISEAWLRSFTQVSAEAIVSSAQSKELDTYREMMLAAFEECHRVLKPGRWITVEFHNSKAAVWNAIQDSLARAGFVVAQVVILDKKKGTTKQLSYAGTVAKDLIINAYKPRKAFEDRFLQRAGYGVEHEFVGQHLRMLPVDANLERTSQILYSKMLAYYIQHGYEITLDADEFYDLLEDHFLERDGYWFRDEEQVQEYEQRKLKAQQEKRQQQVLFISDERSAITWLHHFLETPRDYTEIYTAFVKALQVPEDQIPEIKILLEENFVRVNGEYKRPEKLEKRELEARRQKRLLREFEDILEEARRGQKLKAVRKEAVLAGFTKCYREKRFDDILRVGHKLDDRIVESSTEIYDFVDIAEAKVG